MRGTLQRPELRSHPITVAITIRNDWMANYSNLKAYANSSDVVV